MIKTGCASVHPEDFSFLSSAGAKALLQDKNMVIESMPLPEEKPSADVLFVDANNLNKLQSEIDLVSRTWVLISSNEADAWRAWQLGAAGFLLRPFSLQQFAQTLDRVEQCYYWKRHQLPPEAQMPAIELQMTKGRRLSVSSSDILYLEARGEITCVHLTLPGQEKLIATRNLGYWEEQLSGQQFVRTHKKYLVNIAHVSGVGADEIRVRQHVLPVAKRRRKEVEKTILKNQKHHVFAPVQL